MSALPLRQHGARLANSKLHQSVAIASARRLHPSSAAQLQNFASAPLFRLNFLEEELIKSRALDNAVSNQASEATRVALSSDSSDASLAQLGSLLRISPAIRPPMSPPLCPMASGSAPIPLQPLRAQRVRAIETASSPAGIGCALQAKGVIAISSPKAATTSRVEPSPSFASSSGIAPSRPLPRVAAEALPIKAELVEDAADDAEDETSIEAIVEWIDDDEAPPSLRSLSPPSSPGRHLDGILEVAIEDVAGEGYPAPDQSPLRARLAAFKAARGVRRPLAPIAEEHDVEEEAASDYDEELLPALNGKRRRAAQRGSRHQRPRTAPAPAVAAEPALASPQEIRELALEDLQRFMHLPINDAAPALGVCVTLLKKRVRELGVSRWPGRRIGCLDKIVRELQAVLDADVQFPRLDRPKVEKVLHDAQRLRETPGLIYIENAEGDGVSSQDLVKEFEDVQSRARRVVESAAKRGFVPNGRPGGARKSSSSRRSKQPRSRRHASDGEEDSD